MKPIYSEFCVSGTVSDYLHVLACIVFLPLHVLRLTFGPLQSDHVIVLATCFSFAIASRSALARAVASCTFPCCRFPLCSCIIIILQPSLGDTDVIRVCCDYLRDSFPSSVVHRALMCSMDHARTKAST